MNARGIPPAAELFRLEVPPPPCPDLGPDLDGGGGRYPILTWDLTWMQGVLQVTPPPS